MEAEIFNICGFLFEPVPEQLLRNKEGSVYSGKGPEDGEIRSDH